MKKIKETIVLLHGMVLSGEKTDGTVTQMVKDSMERLVELEMMLEKVQDKLDKILSWINAYPLEVFPEPDFRRAARVLKDNGMTIDAISASNMRHVLNGVSDIINEE